MNPTTLLTDKPYVILGNGGHAAVVIDLILAMGGTVSGVVSPEIEPGTQVYRQVTAVGNDEQFSQKQSPDSVYLALGIGERSLRRTLFQSYSQAGFEFPVLVHPQAVVSDTVEIGAAGQIMAGSVVQARSVLKQGVIVNTKASVDHDCVLDDFVHIAPNACLCGSVRVGTMVHVGAGATVIQEISLSADTFIKAGLCIKQSQ